MADASKRPPRVTILGPPGSGKTTLIPYILEGGKHAGMLEYVKAGKRYHEEQKRRGPAHEVTHPAWDSDGYLPFLTDLFEDISRSGKGWLLEKGPRLMEHYVPWKEAGIFPDRVVVLDCDPEELVARARCRLQDPVTGQSYNTQGNMPEDPAILARLAQRAEDVDQETIRTRIQNFERVNYPVLSLYPPEIVMHFQTSSATPREIAEKINAFIDQPLQMAPANFGGA